MEYGILKILTLVGSLGLFLYGMKLMSEALQKVAGDRMRSILSAMTSNRIKGVFTGFLITAIIQSSSATTVLIVSFVNAGLLSLVESIGVIMGANIGTTVTAWIISIFGFKVNISIFSLPLIGIGFPLVFSKNSKRKSWGEFIIGFAIIFLGLQYLKSSVPNISENPEILAFLRNYTDLGFGSLLLFIGIGTILTVVIQSSSATMALTLVMCNNGWISFELAAAMVLGENIGTTITANIAAAVANVSAKRAARAHLIFNVFGVVWVLCMFPYFLKMIDHFIIYMGGTSPYSVDENGMLIATSIPVALSIFHTTFNIANTILLVGFASLLVRIVQKLVVLKDEDEEEFRLKYINIGMLSTSELSLLQAKKEIQIYAKRTTKMFGFIRCLYSETNEKKFNKLFTKSQKYEDISDRMEVEIATYLTKVSEGELSKLGSQRVKAMLKIISDIESISDSNYNIAITINRKKQQKIWFTQDIRDNILKMFELVGEAFEVMNLNLEHGYEGVDFDKANECEKKINEYRNELKKQHLHNIENNKYKYQAGIIYNDIFSECEKLGDYIINVTESIEEIIKSLS